MTLFNLQGIKKLCYYFPIKQAEGDTMEKKRQKQDLKIQKLKLFYIANYLMTETDADEAGFEEEPHGKYVSDIKAFLETKGIKAEEHSISRDIRLLREYFKMDIKGGNGKRFYVDKRFFDTDKLDMVIECIASAKFISNSDEEMLIAELKKFFSKHQAKWIFAEYNDLDRPRRTQDGTLDTIREIKKAIKQKHIINFRYTTRRINDLNNPIPRRNGKKYTVSPFKIVMSEGNHYLVGYDHTAKQIRTFRIDRIPKVEPNALIPIEGKEAFDDLGVRNFPRQTFGMFVGHPQPVTIQFSNSMLDTVWDRFGKQADTVYRKVDDEHFSLTTSLVVSPVFYGWLCGLGEKAVITSPAEVAQDFQVYLKKIADNYC